ncbi:Lachrymatory-factor synthase [Acorus calamus]|uniref:Lachrymatory-factor synthase n=1 Tax=Acorus calamus TaxID=4465 RepID=A0AAV9ESC9_ACOCL|nr:Lachrymatory-factor synthase [Acorus calamus]
MVEAERCSRARNLFNGRALTRRAPPRTLSSNRSPSSTATSAYSPARGDGAAGPVPGVDDARDAEREDEEEEDTAEKEAIDGGGGGERVKEVEAGEEGEGIKEEEEDGVVGGGLRERRWRRGGGGGTLGRSQWKKKPKLEWEGKVTATLTNTTADQAWSLLKDFTNHHKILPTLHTCHLVEGNDGEIGCVRYCAAAGGDGVVIWAKERLIEIDPVRRFLRYVIEENKIGFRQYFARIGAVDGGGGDGGGGWCVVELSGLM